MEWSRGDVNIPTVGVGSSDFHLHKPSKQEPMPYRKYSEALKATVTLLLYAVVSSIAFSLDRFNSVLKIMLTGNSRSPIGGNLTSLNFPRFRLIWLVHKSIY